MDKVDTLWTNIHGHRDILMVKPILLYMTIEDYILKMMEKKLTTREQDGGIQKGQGQPHVYGSDLNNILIPSLSLSHQQEIVDLLDEIYKTYKIEDTIKYFGDKNIFNLLIEQKYDDFKTIL